MLRKNPAFTAVATLTLAIGIGANTAIFSLTDAVLLRPPPYPESNRLVRVWQSEPKIGEGHLGTAPPEFLAYRDRTRAFSSIAGYQPASFDITGGGAPEHVLAYRVSGSLFDTLGVRPLLGGTIRGSFRAASDAGIVVLSHHFWKQYFGNDPNAVGRVLRLNERPYRVIGIMPEGFMFPATSASPGQPPALWVPLTFTGREMNDWASSFDTSVIARLRPGVTLAQAEDDVKRVAGEFQREHPDIYSGNLRLAASAEMWSPDFSARTRMILWMLTGAVAFVLLIACANVANLLLARVGTRQREMSIRRALGASAGRLARQVLTETALLTIGGGVAGCALGYALLRAMNTEAISEINIAGATMDLRVLLFTFLACAVASILCGIAPALMFRSVSTRRTGRSVAVVRYTANRRTGRSVAVVRYAVNDALKQSSSTQAGSSGANRRLARLFIVGQVACCVVLLVGSGLLLRSFVRILEVPPGFDPEHALTIRTTLNRQRYSPERRHAVERAIESRLRSIPGVAGVALTTHLPLADDRKIGFVVDGRPADEFHWADNALVSATYFRVMKIPLLRGRMFSDADTPQSPLVAIVNQSMARQYWPNEDALGKGFKWGGRHLKVIGIAGDVHVEALDQPVDPTIYNSVYQIESGAITSAVFILRLRTSQDPMGLAFNARNIIASVDKGLPILGFGALREVISGSLAIRRLSLGLAAAFSAVALLLCLIGIYGLLAYDVMQRSREIGVRIALGAEPRRVANSVVAESARLAMAGIAAGLITSGLATRFLSKLLFQVPALDWISFAGSVFALLCAALLASYLPARRASRVDPMLALRYE